MNNEPYPGYDIEADEFLALMAAGFEPCASCDDPGECERQDLCEQFFNRRRIAA